MRGGALLEAVFVILLALVFCQQALQYFAGGGSVEEIADNEAAVVFDYMTGEGRVVVDPGFQTVVPYLQGVFTVDKSPVEYLMRGNDVATGTHVPRLVVRARDGSSFWFEYVTIQCAVSTESLMAVLEDAGPGDGFKQELIDAFARPILRDAYGRYSAEDIVLPENRQAATLAAKERLAEALAPHGIEVLELSASKPMFAKEYEATIERRKVAEQETDSLGLKAEELAAARDERLAKIAREKSLELEKVRGKLEGQIEAASLEGLLRRAAADAYETGRLLAGRLELTEKSMEAEARTAKYAKEAEGFLAQAEALAEQGELAVRAALVEKLQSVEFVLAPYNRKLPDGAAGGSSSSDSK
jgi:hypothetical protein